MPVTARVPCCVRVVHGSRARGEQSESVPLVEVLHTVSHLRARDMRGRSHARQRGGGRRVRSGITQDKTSALQRTYLSQRNRSSITRGAVGHSIPLVEGRRALRGAGAEPERLATRAWGMSGPVRIQEQNRTDKIESSQAWLVAKVVPGESQAFLLFLYGCRVYWAQIHMKIDFVRI